MPDPTEAFFARLAERGHEPALQRTSASLRIDLDRDGSLQQWQIEFRRGAVTVFHPGEDADCVIAAPARPFGDLASGKADAMAAALSHRAHDRRQAGIPSACCVLDGGMMAKVGLRAT